ncbi:MAG TPA: hypothetical protein VMX17_10375 [Candidatus Glassbacteria bacterium]|nr:hypothetical protein [Candidatus Glassbacteria bacterium]
MAYIVGLVTKKEEAELIRRGWETESPPEELRSKELDDEYRTIMIFVDCDLFEIMSGPDWEKGPDETVDDRLRMPSDKSRW